jgi:hypothetical protein
VLFLSSFTCIHYSFVLATTRSLFTLSASQRPRAPLWISLKGCHSWYSCWTMFNNDQQTCWKHPHKKSRGMMCPHCVLPWLRCREAVEQLSSLTWPCLTGLSWSKQGIPGALLSQHPSSASIQCSLDALHASSRTSSKVAMMIFFGRISELIVREDWFDHGSTWTIFTSGVTKKCLDVKTCH